MLIMHVDHVISIKTYTSYIYYIFHVDKEIQLNMLFDITQNSFSVSSMNKL